MKHIVTVTKKKKKKHLKLGGTSLEGRWWALGKQRSNARIREICEGAFGKTITCVAWKENKHKVPSASLAITVCAGVGWGGERIGKSKDLSVYEQLH